MKKITMFLLLATMIATTASAQYDPISLDLARKHQDTTKTLLTQYKASQTYLAINNTNIETASAHNYNITGKPLVILTASRKDTINLVHANYSTGYSFNIICTNSSNDSTLIIPDAGTVNGAGSYWFVGTLKHMAWYYDGTNYWIK